MKSLTALLFSLALMGCSPPGTSITTVDDQDAGYHYRHTTFYTANGSVDQRRAPECERWESGEWRSIDCEHYGE